MITQMPNRLFGLELKAKEDSVSARIPRVHTGMFDMKAAQLGSDAQGRFVAAIPKEPPTVNACRALRDALSRVDTRPLVICWDAMDAGMMGALALEGIAYIRDAKNACLPFLGSIISSTGPKFVPKKLSPQAQRIILNLIAGRWDGCTAGELAKLVGKSNASVTKYLSEIQAVAPGVIENKGVRRVLRNPGYSRKELLNGFVEYLSDPSERFIRLKCSLPLSLLRDNGAFLAGESALSFFSDLALSGVTAIGLTRDRLMDLNNAAGNSWQEAEWYEPALMTVEVWNYSVDVPWEVSVPSCGLPCADALNLYAACVNRDAEDVRYQDAVEQLREVACR